MLLLTKLSNFFILAEKVANTEQASPSPLYSFLPMVVLFALMYFLLIRPQKKKQKQVEQMRNELKAGNRIVTIGGFVGKVKKIVDDEIYLVLNTEENKHVVIKKWAVQTVLTKEEAREIEKNSKKALNEPISESDGDELDVAESSKSKEEVEKLDEFKK